MRILTCLLILGLARVLSAATVVIPSAFTHMEGNSNALDPNNNLTHLQQLFGSDLFPGNPVLITEIDFRPHFVSGPRSWTIPNIKISLSTTPLTPASMTGVFANNFGSNSTVVYNGSLSLSSSFTSADGGATKTFDIRVPLMTPFLYDPSKGSLLLDIQNLSSTPLLTVPFDRQLPVQAPFYDISQILGGESNAAGGVSRNSFFITALVLGGNGAPPTITSVLNGASFRPGFEAANYVTITGSNFTSAQANCDPVSNPVVGCRTWAGKDFSDGTALGIAPMKLDDVSVAINGKPGFVEFVSPTQINVQAPDDATVGSVNVTVTTPGGSATAVGVLQQFSPAFLVYGANFIVASHLDGSIVGGIAGTTPAKPGEVIVLYGFGFGPTSPPVRAGQSPAGQQISSPAVPLVNPVTITIGGSVAQQTPGYTGLAGTFIGLYQFVVTFPNVPNGDQAITAEVGTVSTPSGVTINVHN